MVDTIFVRFTYTSDSEYYSYMITLCREPHLPLSSIPGALYPPNNYLNGPAAPSTETIIHRLHTSRLFQIRFMQVDDNTVENSIFRKLILLYMTKESLPELPYSNPGSVWFSSCFSTCACSLPEIRRINTGTKSSTEYKNNYVVSV